jgi:hypothetical protein
MALPNILSQLEFRMLAVERNAPRALLHIKRHYTDEPDGQLGELSFIVHSRSVKSQFRKPGKADLREAPILL